MLVPVALTQRKATVTKRRRNHELFFVSMLLEREWAFDFFLWHHPYFWCQEKLSNWPLKKNCWSTPRRGHLGLRLSDAPGFGGLRCPLLAARAALCAPSRSYCLRWGQGPAGGAGFWAELRILETEDRRWGREMSPKATPRVSNARARVVGGGRGTSGCGGGPGCKSPSCGCYWQPSLCRARSPAAPGTKVAREAAAAARPRRLGSPQGSRSRPRPAVPPGLDCSCAAKTAEGLSGWGLRCLGSVKWLAASAKATWQLGLQEWDPCGRLRGGGGGLQFLGREWALPAPPTPS